VILQQAIDNFGEISQLLMAIEEASELIMAITHRWRGRVLDDAVIEEIADVKIMCWQLELIFGEKEVDEMVEFKLQRLKTLLLSEGD